MQQQHNKDNMLLEVRWREMQDELQGVRGFCYTLKLIEGTRSKTSSVSWNHMPVTSHDMYEYEPYLIITVSFFQK